MKMHSAASTVETSVGLVAENYCIEGSPKAFMLLSDGMYSHKELAVIREISTNAYDAHVDAGYADKPFEVHLPTAIEPYFYVRDFGISMTHDQCMTLYKTFFKSTKTNTNDSVGCLGLGSKSPLAYSNSFTVEAYLNGEKRIYSGFKDTTGDYKFVPMGISSTDEPNGIKVSVPVKAGDITKFHTIAGELYKHWKVKPIVNVKIDMVMPDPIIAANDSKWAFHNMTDNYVVMGQVPYKVNSYELSQMFETDVSDFCYNLRGLIMYVNIGDVDFTPSRESLSFNPQTKAKLQEVLSHVMKDVKNSIETSISGQASLFLARNKYVEIQERCSSLNQVTRSLKDSVMWNGVKLFDSMGMNSVTTGTSTVMSASKSHYRSKINIDRDLLTVHFGEKVVFAIDDLKRGGVGRVRQYLKDNNRGHVYVYTLAENETVDNCPFYDILGGATPKDVLLVSSMPKPERQSYSTTDRTYGQVTYFDQYSEKFLTCGMSVKEEDAVYIPIRKTKAGNYAVINNRSVDISVVQRMLIICYRHRFFDKKFIFVPESTVESRKLEGRDNWEGPEYFIEMLKDIANAHKDTIYAMRHAPRIGFTRLHNAILNTSTDNKAKEIVANYRDKTEGLEKNTDVCNNIICTCTALGLSDLMENCEGFNENAEFAIPLEIEMAKYPMISFVSGVWLEKSQEQKISDYIDFVENQVLTDNVLPV